MCGILGIYQSGGAPVDSATLRRMMDVQRHRGPDDVGAHFFSFATGRSAAWDAVSPAPADPFEGALGFNRLSILDLSASGHQPMVGRDARVAIAFNGEIYNAFDYREELEADGFVFRSRTDTEVLLYLYERHGLAGMLRRLNGMFAIALIDLRDRSLTLVRDRLGIKPLYWYERDGLFLFSSEIKSFLEHPAFRAELAEENLDEYLLFRFCSADRTLLSGVRQLEPGCWLRVDARGKSGGRYWSVPDDPPDPLVFEDGLEQLDAHLQRSVRLRLLSDVKVGCQLSGGIDSSLVNVFATRHGGADMDAFSVIFDDPRLSEEEWIDIAAQKAQVRSHKMPLDATRFVDQLDRTTWHLDQPLNHPNSIGIDCVSDFAKRYVTVLLSGEGADELLGGYIRYYWAALRPQHRALLALAGRLPGVGPRLESKFALREGLDDVDWFVLQSAHQSPDRVARLRPDGGAAVALAVRRATFEEGRGDFLRNGLRYEQLTHLVDLLVRQDKMTMAHSMENRVPFLDHELVAFARSLPTGHLVRGGLGSTDPRMRNTKVVLKKLALRYFDRRFVYRPKRGFDFPLRDFFADRRFVELMEERLLPGMRARGAFDASIVEAGWRGPAAAAGDVAALEAVWIPVAFEVWAQQFLDGARPTVPPPRAPRIVVDAPRSVGAP